MKRLIEWLTRRQRYVIADPVDNSITFSKRLYKDLRVEGLEQAKVMTVKLGKDGDYAFTINPPIEQETQLAEIMYNSKHKCVGYECLVPTVNRIFYDYMLPAGQACRLSVTIGRSNNLTYYRIHRPKI